MSRMHTPQDDEEFSLLDFLHMVEAIKTKIAASGHKLEAVKFEDSDPNHLGFTARGLCACGCDAWLTLPPNEAPEFGGSCFTRLHVMGRN